MDMTGVVAIVCGSVVLIFLITAWAVVRLVGGVRHKRQATEPDESRMMQEVYQGFLKMEKRVETLETLLLERERARKRSES